MKLGAEGVRRAVRTLPSAVSIRTSTSVSVRVEPVDRDPLPCQARASQLTRPCSMKAPPACIVVGSATVRQESGQSRLYAEPERPERRHLPGHQEDVRGGLAQLQKAWPHLVRARPCAGSSSAASRPQQQATRLTAIAAGGLCTITR